MDRGGEDDRSSGCHLEVPNGKDGRVTEDPGGKEGVDRGAEWVLSAGCRIVVPRGKEGRADEVAGCGETLERGKENERSEGRSTDRSMRGAGAAKADGLPADRDCEDSRTAPLDCPPLCAPPVPRSCRGAPVAGVTSNAAISAPFVKEARERTAVAQSRKRAGVSMILCLGKGVNRDGSPCGVEQARYPPSRPADPEGNRWHKPF